MAAPITVNWSDLEIAFERNAPTYESFLDLDNGDLLAVTEGEPDAAARLAKVAADPARYLRVDPASSREQYRWMEEFVVSVEEPVLRERLLIAIDGKGAFRRFKDALLAFPAERERWFNFRAGLLHAHIQTWLDHSKVEVANPPPWSREGADLEGAHGTGSNGHGLLAHGGAAGHGHHAPVHAHAHVHEGPGEILRKQARELLDDIPAAELPSAIAFLEFLRDRGAAMLLHGEALRRSTTPRPLVEAPPLATTRPAAAVAASPGAVASGSSGAASSPVAEASDDESSPRRAAG